MGSLKTTKKPHLLRSKVRLDASLSRLGLPQALITLFRVDSPRPPVTLYDWTMPH